MVRPSAGRPQADPEAGGWASGTYDLSFSPSPGATQHAVDGWTHTHTHTQHTHTHTHNTQHMHPDHGSEWEKYAPDIPNQHVHPHALHFAGLGESRESDLFEGGGWIWI